MQGESPEIIPGSPPFTDEKLSVPDAIGVYIIAVRCGGIDRHSARGSEVVVIAVPLNPAGLFHGAVATEEVPAAFRLIPEVVGNAPQS